MQAEEIRNLRVGVGQKSYAVRLSEACSRFVGGDKSGGDLHGIGRDLWEVNDIGSISTGVQAERGPVDLKTSRISLPGMGNKGTMER